VLKIRKIITHPYLLPSLVFLIPLIIYSITLTGTFVYDDNVQIIGNPWIRDPGKIPALFISSTMGFKSGQTANTYRPIFYIIYMAEYFVFGLKPWGWHLVNIVLHSMNSLAVFTLVSLLSVQKESPAPEEKSLLQRRFAAPFFAALVFALHPVNSEVVAWVGAIPELVYTLMLLCAFNLYILAEKTSKRAVLYRIASVASFTIALFSKETAMALIIIIPLYEITRLGYGALRRWKIYLCYLLPAILYMFMRTYALGGMTQMSLIKMTPYEGLLNVTPLVARYIGKLILPLGLSIVYSFEPVRSATDIMFIIGLLVSAALGLIIYYMKDKKDELFFLLWILIPLLPVLYMPILSVGGFADRYLYLSTAGFASFISLLIFRALEGIWGDNKHKKIVNSAMVLMLLLYSAGCVQRAFVWHNDISLWSDAVTKSPSSHNVLYNLGWALHQRGNPGDLESALKWYEEAIRIEPNKEEAHYNAAMIYKEKGNNGMALKHFMASLRLKPSATTCYHIASIYQAIGQTSKAIVFFKQAIVLEPEDQDSLYNLAWAYQDMDDYKNALINYRKVVKLDPDSSDAHYNMGIIFEDLGNRREALGEFQAALAADPGYGAARLKIRELLGPER